MTLSLDSSVLVDLLRSRQDVRRRYEQARDAGAAIHVSAVAVHELSYGAEKSADPQRKLDEAMDLVGQLTSAAFDDLDAVAAGVVRFELQPSGDPIGTADLLIAAQARRRGWAIVTSNVRHFGRVRGLTLIDWRISGEPLSREQVLERIGRAA